MKAQRVAGVLGALGEAGVQAIVVGDPVAGPELRLVVSRHPTNLVALGRALDRLGARLEPLRPTRAGAGLRRVGDPLGTLRATVAGGRLALSFGGPNGSLYAETLETSEDRVVAGVQVRWAPDPAGAPPPDRGAPEVGRRILSLADALSDALDLAASPQPDTPRRAAPAPRRARPPEEPPGGV